MGPRMVEIQFLLPFVLSHMFIPSDQYYVDEQLLLMTSSKDYEPCDGNELCHVMLQTDADIRNDYKRYDTYKAGDAGTVADDVKAAGAARTAITRAF